MNFLGQKWEWKKMEKTRENFTNEFDDITLHNSDIRYKSIESVHRGKRLGREKWYTEFEV